MNPDEVRWHGKKSLSPGGVGCHTGAISYRERKVTLQGDSLAIGWTWTTRSGTYLLVRYFVELAGKIRAGSFSLGTEG